MNGDELDAGLMLGVFVVAALFTRPFAGRALDRMGRRKILLTGLLAFIISLISLTWALSVGIVLLLRAVQGIGWGITTTAYGTIVSDLIEPSRRAEGIGYYGISNTIGLATAPLFGIWVMQQFGFAPLFLTATAMVMINVGLAWLINLPSLPADQGSTEKKKDDNLIERKALFPALLAMFMTIVHGGILSSLTLFGLEVGIVNVGWFFLVNAVFIVLARPVAGKIFDQKGHEYILIPGGISLGLGLLLLSYATNVMTLTGAAIFYGLGFGSIQPTLQAWTINRVSPHRRGAAIGTYFSAFDLGLGTGAVLLGLIAKWTSYAVIYRISIVFMVIYGLVYGLYLINEKKQAISKNNIQP
jgi:MFS family permease